ncbi:MAG: uroporphyrinogen decarboxylase family protein [Candidatus Hodarchaeota archaeon]
MDGITPEERVWKSLNHEEPDRIPLYEASIEIPRLVGNNTILKNEPGILFFPPNILQFFATSWFKPLRKMFFKLLQNPNAIESLLKPFVKLAFNNVTSLHRSLGIDMFNLVGGLPMVFNPRLFDDVRVWKKTTILSPSGDVATKVSRSTHEGAAHRNGFLRSPEDYDKYMEMNPDNPVNTFLTEGFLKSSKNKMCLNFSIYGAAFFEELSSMFGFDTLFRLLIKDPGFIKKVVRDLSDYSIAVMERMADQGARIFYITSDIGAKNRSIISPKMYEKFFKAGIAKFCKKVHEHGGKVIMHSCGYSMNLIPMFLEAGIDGLHPWERSAGMNIFEGKKKWGKKLTLIGNIPIEILSHGTRDETQSYVKSLIRDVAPGGGYIMSSSHSVVSSCKFENYITALKTHGIYGNYPIKL